MRQKLVFWFALILASIVLVSCNTASIPNNPDADDTAENGVTEGTYEAKTEDTTQAEEETTEDYFEVTRIETVIPDTTKVIDMAVTDGGYDIFRVSSDRWAYRYGATYLYNDDNTIDAYFACIGANGEWDWISYRHSNDGGESWSDEKIVLTPTTGSLDQFSNCDPGVVYFNGYYYLGYTSTINSKGVCNWVYVARSKNPDGPFEKWNGSSWGGDDPQPIFYYDEHYSTFGMGEPSFIELNGTLYIYYTNAAPTGLYTMLATADATDENWPLTIQNRGAVVKRDTDSLDVKYIEDWGKFIAIGTGDRMGPNSWIGVFESNDGLNFELVDVVRKGTFTHLHNAGISSRRNGHINLAEDADKLCVLYAYGETWGYWNTRSQPISLQLSEGNDMQSEKAEHNINVFAIDDPIPASQRPIALICTEKDVYTYPRALGYFTPVINTYTDNLYIGTVPRKTEGVTFEVVDESVCKINPDTWRITVVGLGKTEVKVSYLDFEFSFFVEVVDSIVQSEDKEALELVPVRESYTLYIGEQSVYRPQLRVRMLYSDGSFDEYYAYDSDQVVNYSDYDTNIISISASGEITALSVGETYVTVSKDGMSCSVKFTVSDDPADGFYIFDK